MAQESSSKKETSQDLEQIGQDLRDLEADTFEVEDLPEVDQNAAVKKGCTSCCSCTSTSS